MKIVSKNLLHSVVFAAVVCGGTVQAEIPRFGELKSVRGKIITSVVVKTADKVIPEDGYKNEKSAILDGLTYGIEGLLSGAKPAVGADKTSTFYDPTSGVTCFTKAVIVGSMSYGFRIVADKYIPSREEIIKKCNALTDNKTAQKVMNVAVDVVAETFEKPLLRVSAVLFVIEKFRS